MKDDFSCKKEPSPEAPSEQVQPKFEIKKRERKETTAKKEEPAPSEQGEMFKMKKKSSVTRKPIQKEEEQPAFAGFKLKKAETVKRQWDDGGMEKVDLKHHEFEKIPQEEQVLSTTQTLTKGCSSFFPFFLQNLRILRILRELQTKKQKFLF